MNVLVKVDYPFVRGEFYDHYILKVPTKINTQEWVPRDVFNMYFREREQARAEVSRLRKEIEKLKAG